MCGEQRCPHVDAKLDRKSSPGAQQLALGFSVKTIARFDLDCGYTFRGKRRKPWPTLRHQFAFGGGAGCTHRGVDAATAFGDRFVAGALQTRFEFACTIARIDEMIVTV